MYTLKLERHNAQQEVVPQVVTTLEQITANLQLGEQRRVSDKCSTNGVHTNKSTNNKYRTVNIELKAPSLLHQAVSATGLNIKSSRAHTVFNLVIAKHSELDNGTPYVSTVSIKLVDLAGAEHLSKTHNKWGSEQARRGVNIMQSLTHLGYCINLLAKVKT